MYTADFLAGDLRFGFLSVTNGVESLKRNSLLKMSL